MITIGKCSKFIKRLFAKSHFSRMELFKTDQSCFKYFAAIIPQQHKHAGLTYEFKFAKKQQHQTTTQKTTNNNKQQQTKIKRHVYSFAGL